MEPLLETVWGYVLIVAAVLAGTLLTALVVLVLIGFVVAVSEALQTARDQKALREQTQRKLMNWPGDRS